jgi:hypothetical protein
MEQAASPLFSITLVNMRMTTPAIPAMSRKHHNPLTRFGGFLCPERA